MDLLLTACTGIISFLVVTRTMHTSLTLQLSQTSIDAMERQSVGCHGSLPKNGSGHVPLPSTSRDPYSKGEPSEPSFTFYFAIGPLAALTQALRTFHLHWLRGDLCRGCLCKRERVSPRAVT